MRKNLLLVMLCLAGCTPLDQRPYGVKLLTKVDSVSNINIDENHYKFQKSFKKNAFFGMVTGEYDEKKHDFHTTNVIFGNRADEESIYDSETECDCIDFLNKYYFLTKEKMLDLFPLSLTTAYKTPLSKQCVTFKLRLDESSSYEFLYLLENNFLLLRSAYFYKQDGLGPSYEKMAISSDALA